MKAREKRRKVIIPARMRNEDGWVDAIIHNLSSQGLGLRSSSAPERGAYIEIFRLHYKLIGRVVWRNGDNFGVRLQDKVSVEDFIAAQPRPRNGEEDQRGERRGATRDAITPPAPSIEERLERSRQISRMMNFGALLAAVCVGAWFLFSGVSAALAPLQKVADALR